MTRSFFVLTIVVAFGCSSKARKVDDPLDTLTVRQGDYDSMREYYRHDSLFISSLDKKVVEGDNSAMKMKTLLNTPFHLRSTAGLNETEIKATILSYHASKEVTDKFRAIEKTLVMTDTITIRSRTDSILKSIDKLKNTLETN
jgi:hypothetical protein